MATRAPRSAKAMASGRPTWPQPPITTTWRSNWPDSDVPVIACLPVLPCRVARHPLDASPYRSPVTPEFRYERSAGASEPLMSCTRLAVTIPLLRSVNSKDVRRVDEEYMMGGSEAETAVVDAGTTPASHA